MPFHVVNYARSPHAGGKFVVMTNKRDPDSGLLLLSDFIQDSQHADIVRRWKELQTTYPNDSAPPHTSMRTAGGGWWKMDGETLVLYGRSAAYGKFDEKWLRLRLQPGMVFHETKVDVE